MTRLIQDSQRRPGNLAYLLLVTLLGLPLVTPLLRWAQVPCTHDGHLHYHRLAAMRYAWESGLPFSRWLPDVVFGYGYPFFNYREAPPLYASLLPHLLGMPLPAAINLFYILSILAAGWFMFLWVRDVFGPLAGLVSAVAYMAAPYVLIDALIRGNQPESMGLALLPLITWSGRRFIRDGKAWAFVITTLSLALLALSHNISIFLFAPLLILYFLAVGWWGRLRWQTIALRAGLVLILGLGLAAFYSGPALLELDQITIHQSVNTRGNDFHFNFATLAEIFEPVSPANPALLNPPLSIRLGLAPAVLALLGLVSLIWIRAGERRGHILFMGLSAIAMLIMTLFISTPIWEGVPLVEFVQFPWRFIGRAALPVAFLAGVPFSVLADRTAGGGRRYLAPVLSAGAILLLLLEATPNLYPHLCRELAQPTIETVHQYEHNTGLIGVDPAGSYFPKTALSRPDGSQLEEDYQAGRIPQRFDQRVLPAGAAILSSEYGPLSAHLEVTTPEPFQARYLSYAFPGWQVLVNGERAPITPSDPEGLITFLVSAGTSAIEVDWRLTSLRGAMATVSASALCGVFVTAIVLKRRGNGEKRSGGEEEKRGFYRASWADLAPILIVGVGFLAFKGLVMDRVETPLRRAAAPEISYPADLTGAELRLAGHNLSQDNVAAGESFDIDLAWLVEAPPAGDYQSNIWLVGPSGMTWSDKETQRPRIYEETAPTGMWLPGQWAWDSREVQVLPGTPPGQYDIVLTLFDLADLSPLTLSDEAGSTVGPMAVIGQIQVVQPHVPLELPPQLHQINQDLNDLTLLGYSQDRQEGVPGEQMLLTLFWEKPDSYGGPADTLSLNLRDSGGQIAQSWDLPPVRADYPPEVWPAGATLRGQHTLRLAGGLESGEYRFELAGLPLGALEIAAPERLFEEPAYDKLAGANFRDQAELVGYTIEPDPMEPQTTALTLIWHGLAEMPVSYRVFVHLVDEDGQIVAQSDGEPAGWGRPTTGWTVGEYVVDQHTLPLPLGPLMDDLVLRIGLYDVLSGNRLMVGQEDAFEVQLGN
ncbi:MAG: glycosyltransferase family 39 protein [Chloroflexota bacterium]|nr:MAG: glycosyltransferase family 39 protein [Chloroflexota bacterium]